MAAATYFEDYGHYEFTPQDVIAPPFSRAEQMQYSIEEFLDEKKKLQELQDLEQLKQLRSVSNINYSNYSGYSSGMSGYYPPLSARPTITVWTCTDCNRYNHHSASVAIESIHCAGCNGPFSPKPPTHFAETITNEEAAAQAANRFKPTKGTNSSNGEDDESRVDRGLVIKIDPNNSLEVLELRQKVAMANGWLSGRCNSCHSNLDLNGICGACQLRLQFPLSAHSVYHL